MATCIKCGEELVEGAKFCYNCGSSVIEERGKQETPKKEFASEQIDANSVVTDEHQTEEIKVSDIKAGKNKKKTLSNIVKEKISAYWHKIDLFCKIETIAIPLAVLLIIIAFCVKSIFPIIISILQLGGLIAALLMHKNLIKLDKKWIKYVVLSAAILLTCVNIPSYSWFTTIKVPYAASECVGKNKDTVWKDFSSAEFSKIKLIALEDLDKTDADKNGLVESVTVDGSNKFEANEEFGKSSKVVIKYHSYKRVSVPLSNEEAKSMDAAVIENAFKEAGFVNITLQEKYDLDPSTMTTEFEISVSVGENSAFEKGESFPLDSEVIIVIHRAREKYKLELIIDFTENLLFNKYKVTIEIGEYSETLNHGKDGHFEYILERGTYKITFRKKGSKSIKKTVEIDLTGDTKAAYKISCQKSKISVKNLYIENQSNVGEGEAMIPISASDCEYENYTKIEKKFRDAGFTNIKYKILYDIVYGITDEGEVEKVSVDGKTSFRRGDVFATNVEIVITYHMKEEDDPKYYVVTEHMFSHYIGKDYQSVEQEFLNMGFTNVTIDYEWTTDESRKDGEIKEILINGGLFGTGDKYKKDSQVTITCWKISSTNDTTPDAPSIKDPDAVFYSTNNYETAKKGNTGVFSYKNKGGTYDVYWIIDFDKGYVYYFTHGNGENTCERIKITSGTLNDRVTITWNFDGEKTNWYLHFKYIGQPVTLVVNDHFGTAIEFTTADLNKAISIRGLKSIVDR